MRKSMLLVSLLGFVVVASAFGQNYRGAYTSTSGGVTLTLVLEQDLAGRITGTLSSTKGTRFRLEGKIQEGIATGNCSGESGQSYFEAEFEDAKLIFTLVEVSPGGEGTSRSLEFVRSSGGGTKAAPQVPSAPAPRSEAAPRPQIPPTPAPKIPESGNRLSDPQMGVSFIPPSGWIAQKQGGAFLLGSNTYKGFILIQPHSFSSFSQMAEEAGQGIVEEDSGIRLMPVSQLQAFGSNGLAGDFEGIVQGRPTKAFAIGLLSPKGGGVTILVAVESGSYTKDYPGFVRSIASGLKFVEAQPSGPAGSSGGPSDSGLMKYFAGEYYSYSGGSTLSGGAGTERTVTLCPDGTYRDSYEFSASGSGWGGANSQRGAARWNAQGDKSRGVITVTYANGQTKRVSYQALSKDQGTILFDGVKFAYAGAPKCR